jgi:CheY-like chemotaxis protein
MTERKPETDGHKKHMPVALVVDDDDAIRSALAEVLRDERFVVATAEDGRRMLEMLRSGFRPSVVLLDLWMPEVDGLEALRVMKRDPALAKIPVIVITADTDVEDPAEATAVLRKPLDLGELLDHVMTVAA